ncbi:hypothetical protein RP20_CCG011674 [Aedes albopictus]|nr:hypothetical protein RP20_CCG011674 [Aedes albopictus]
MKDLGYAEQILGMRVTQVDGRITLDQEKYIEQLLERFGMNDCNPVSTPFDASQKLSKEMSPKSSDEVERMANVPFRELVGGLQFVAQCTRPDIAFAVNAVSSYNSNPGEAHWMAAKRILRYLKGTKDMKLVYSSESEESFHGYSDADWGNDPETRRSVTGYVFKHSGGAVAWSCRRQPTVALSTTEAEYMAIAAAGQEALWWRSFRAELSGLTTTVEMRCDNRSAMCLAEKEVGYSARTKHIDLRHHFVKEQLEQKTIALQHVPSEGQLADVLTKPVPYPKLREARKSLGVSQIQG